VPRWRTPLLIGAFVALAMTLPPAVDATAPAMREEDRLRQLTEAFASFDVRDMEDRRWTAASLRGRIVLLDFWATWCAPCLADIPWYRQIATRSDSRVQVIGISLDTTDRRALVSWLNRQRVDWPQVWDGRGYESLLAEQFGVESLPTSVLVGADGRVVAVNLRGERLVAAIESLIGPGRYTPSPSRSDKESGRSR
jgi:thiol-disulfide isomerase/thioredoxin